MAAATSAKGSNSGKSSISAKDATDDKSIPISRLQALSLHSKKKPTESWADAEEVSSSTAGSNVKAVAATDNKHCDSETDQDRDEADEADEDHHDDGDSEKEDDEGKGKGEAESGGEIQKESERKHTKVLTHGSCFLLWSREPLVSVTKYLKKLSPVSVLVRQRVDEKTGAVVPGQFEAAMFPRVAECIRRAISAFKTASDLAKAKGKAAPGALVVRKISQLKLDATLYSPDPKTQMSDRLFLTLPQRMPWKPLKKHLDIFFEQIRGLDLADAKQFGIEIPLNNTKTHHRRQCVLWFDTKEAAERRKSRNPDLQIKIGGRVSESNIPFIRHFLNNHLWYESIPLLNNDPDTTAQPFPDKTSPTGLSFPQISPSYVIKCDWERLEQRSKPKAAAPPAKSAVPPPNGATAAATVHTQVPVPKPPRYSK